jgi:hypothetical protein
MRHWFWCRVTRNNGDPDLNEERVRAICKAHGLEVAERKEPPTGLYCILMPEFPEHIEIVMLEMGVGELTVSIE